MFENIHLTNTCESISENPLHNELDYSILNSISSYNMDTMNNLIINENLDNESLIK